MYLHALATALPSASFTQSECWNMFERSAARDRLSRRSALLLQAVLQRDNGIATRHFALPDIETGSREYYTLAGYLLSINGSIPKTGDKIVAGNYLCEIMDMDGHRIDKVLIISQVPSSAE